jgi:hypothetical protein
VIIIIMSRVQALDAGTAAVLPEGLRSELEQLEESGGVRHLNDLKDQIQVRCILVVHHDLIIQ